MKYLLIILQIYTISKVTSLPDGAPIKACRTLLPFHAGGSITDQNSPSPYKISTAFNRGKVLVRISSTLGVNFQGFMIQAKTPNQQVKGQFSSTYSDSQTLDCTNNGDTATHTGKIGKLSVDLEWDPKDYTGPVMFNATVLQDYATFWSSVSTPTLDISKRSLEGEGNIPRPGLSSTTAPNFITPKSNKEAATEFDPFYKGCDVDKACFGAPDGCIASKNCKAVVAITVLGDKYDFELKAINNAQWVGVGLSDDTFMGNDSVIECVNEGRNVKAYMSYTIPRPNLDVQRLNRPQDGIELLSGGSVDGMLTCKVRRNAKTIVNGKEYDLERSQYYLLVAAGSKIHENKVSFHDLAYLASGQKKSLSDVSAIKGASKLLLRLHGAFMLVAWIGTASIGILLARYYRQTWVGSQLCGKDQWFAWHRLFMCLTWLLTSAGFVLIFVELKAWSTEQNPHAILGVVTTILCFIQPIGAYFRPHPGTSKRPIFNWLHWLGGNSAHIIAIITIFFAVQLNKAELPDWFYWVVTGYVAVHVITHLVLSVMGCESDQSKNQRISSFPMKDLGGTGRMSSYSNRSGDAPFSGFRKLLLAIYIILIILIVVALVFIIVVAPVEDFWRNMKDSMKNM